MFIVSKLINNHSVKFQNIFKSKNPLLAVVAISLMTFSTLLTAASLPDFSSLVEKNGPTVVNISSIQKARSQSPYHQRRGDEAPDILRYFFGEGLNVPPQDKKSLGSGFIISHDGYILTNYHVIKDADEVFVRLQDRRELSAKVIGSDTKSDLALLKIKATKLPVVKIGRSDDLKVGEWVLAIGSPFGFEASATKGIVSHLGRSLPRENYVPFIQTDVPINPGNSGGPLFNLSGEVVGINSQIYSRTGGFMGLSFAIPIDTAMNVVAQLKQHGHVQRGWLGVVIQEINRDLADSFGLSKPEGALVAQVLKGSPASKGGLEEGDVILKFGGKTVKSSSDLPILVGATTVDSTIDVQILRNKTKKILKIKIGALPDDGPAKATKTAAEPETDELGLMVSELSKEQKKRWQISHGVAIKQVVNDPALSAGLRQGDIITQINNVDVDSLKEYQQVVGSLPKDKWFPVLVYRAGKPVFMPLYSGEK